MSSVSNGLYFLTLPLVSVKRVIYTSKGMPKKFGVRVIHQVRVIYRKIRHAHYLYIKRNVEKVWGARFTLGARYPSKNTVFVYLLKLRSFHYLAVTQQCNYYKEVLFKIQETMNI